MKKTYPRLFEPFTVGGYTFRNRILAVPLNTPINFDSSGNCFSRESIAYYEERAKGGAGQVTIGENYVDHPSAVGEGFGLFSGRNMSLQRMTSLADMADSIKRHGARAYAQTY